MLGDVGGTGDFPIATSTNGTTWTSRGTAGLTYYGAASRVVLPYVGTQSVIGTARRLGIVDTGSATGPSLYSTTNPDKLRKIVDQVYSINWGDGSSIVPFPVLLKFPLPAIFPVTVIDLSKYFKFAFGSSSKKSCKI